MNTHSVELNGYYARSRGSSTIYLGTAGSHGNEQLQVTQGKGWEGLTVQVVFHPSKVAVQLPANGLLDVPWEATTQPLTSMQGRIVFQGFDQDRLVNSTDLAYTVASHSPALGRDEEPYTPGIVEGVLNQMAADKDAILQAAQQTGQAKEAAAASAAEAAGSAANAQQSAGAANTSAGQAAASASQAAGSAAAAGETLTQVQTAGQEAQQKVKDAETEALDKIAAAAPALPAVSPDSAWQSVTVKPDGTGYDLAALAPIAATIRPTVTGNPAVCENSVAWGLQGLKIYGKSVQNGTPSPEHPVPIVSAGQSGIVNVTVYGTNLFDTESVDIDIIGRLNIKNVSNVNGIISFVSTGGDSYIGDVINKGFSASQSAKQLGFSASPNTQYSISFSDKNLIKNFVSFLDKNDVSISGFTNFKNSTFTFVTPTECEYVILRFGNGDSAIDQQFSTTVMVNVGDPAQLYQPYQFQPLTLSTPNGLPGIPMASGGNYTDSTGQQQICDMVDYEKSEKPQNCMLVTLSGMPKFSADSSQPGRFLWYNAIPDVTFKNAAQVSISNFGEWASWGIPVAGKDIFAVTANSVYFSPSAEMTADEVNTLFAQMIASETPPTILGQLATPIITPLSTEEIAAYRALTTYAGTTVVSTTEHVAGLEVQYVADGTKYAEKVQSMETRLATLEAAQTGI